MHRWLARPRTLALLTVAALAGCASAGKRLEQGLDAESQGSFYEAAGRYIDALEKDGSLREARAHLYEAGDSAVRLGMEAAARDLAAGQAEAAGGEFLSLDRLMARARGVGARLPTPADYAHLRRSTFDEAISELMAESDDAHDAMRWNDARAALARLRRDFEPAADQVALAHEAESHLLLDWSLAEEDQGRFRRAFDLAGEALSGSGATPADVAEAAEAAQDRTLLAGTRGLVVFPLTATAVALEAMETDLDQQLGDLLELDYWRQPPLFVEVADPVAVRQQTRRMARVGPSFRPGPILQEFGADFGALVEMVVLESVEGDLERRSRDTRTQRGQPTTFFEERGRLTLTAQVNIVIVGRRGEELASTRARASRSGRFERGVYRGDPRNLQLSRGEQRLFDPSVSRQQTAAVEEALLEELAERIADQVFSRVLARIP